MQYEAASFDCQTCPVAEAVDGLYPENVTAWRLFQRMCARFVVDTHLAPDVFRVATAGADADTVEDLLERLDVIYRVAMPPVKAE